MNEKFDDLDPNDKNYANHLLKVIKSRKKWYPEKIRDKKRIEQLEYEYMLAEQEESEVIDYAQADVKGTTFEIHFLKILHFRIRSLPLWVKFDSHNQKDV